MRTFSSFDIRAIYGVQRREGSALPSFLHMSRQNGADDPLPNSSIAATPFDSSPQDHGPRRPSSHPACCSTQQLCCGPRFQITISIPDASRRQSEPPRGGDLSWSGVSDALPVLHISTGCGGKARQRRSGNAKLADVLWRPCPADYFRGKPPVSPATFNYDCEASARTRARRLSMLKRCAHSSR
jgi:hypothetical protein